MTTTRTTTLLINGRIYSPHNPDATALAITGDTVSWVGQDGPARVLYPDANIVDLRGAFVAPAFVDAHVHVTAAGLQLGGLDLGDCASLTDCLDAIRSWVRAVSGSGVVWGHGWDETRWPEHRPPTRDELDTVAGGMPVYLSRVDAHSAVVSSALLDRAPQARASAGWSEHGPLTRDAHHHVRGAARAGLDEDQRQAARVAFLRHAAAQGVAAVHECAGPDISGAEDLAELLTFASAGGVPDVVGYWGACEAPCPPPSSRIAGLAGDLFVDGALGSRTAALNEPYADDTGNTGVRYLSVARITEHVINRTRAGQQAGFHAIGDAAVAAVVEGFAGAERELGAAALAACGHRVEHLEMVTARQAGALAKWGVIASVQPTFDALWGGADGMYARRLGRERASWLNPFAMLAAEGVTLAFGSDCPVTPVDPWNTIRAAVHHRTAGSGLSPRAAFTAHTRGGWRAARYGDGTAGTLVPGAEATYAIWRVDELIEPTADSRVKRWSSDPRARVPALPASRPDSPAPTCLRTVSRGAIIYDREGALR